ncbi:hypothetical protein, partial [Lactobacillus johnsonii]|uniref:hypothetical protein n=1 Tax=Lactobacillus johnsonii TaxID=33959 RepID=UPI001B35503E
IRSHLSSSLSVQFIIAIYVKIILAKFFNSPRSILFNIHFPNLSGEKAFVLYTPPLDKLFHNNFLPIIPILNSLVKEKSALPDQLF